jgi:hypothetical protein
MSRKKRRFEQLEAAASQPKEKVSYRDPFQEKLGTKIEEAGKKLEGKGRTILYSLAAVAGAALIFGVFYVLNSRSAAEAQTALGKAIETSQAPISATPPPAGSTQRTFKSERERAEASIAEFQSVAEKYGGDVGEKARYFVAVNRLFIDRPAAIAELQGIASDRSPVGKLAKYALAQTYAADGKYDDAATLYRELSAMPDPVVAKDTLNFELAGIFQKQGKNQEAADIYFDIAKSASEAKDSEGNSVPMTSTAQSAKEKLEELDPERAKQIAEPTPQNPFGGIPFGG